ncbi:unnamed protein product, partial [Durusdinium trenchii]
MAGASSSSDGGYRIFDGEQEGSKEYKRWKVWAKGAYVYTLLQGKALECVEHLDPSDYQKEGGDLVLFNLLDARFPAEEASDEMSEIMTQVFNLRAAEGETLKTWASRVTELFVRCQRKTNVAFPEEARGWIILHRSGLNDEQKAVCLARSLGVLKLEEISKAMRSCYPEFVAPRRKSFAAGLIENDRGDLYTELEEQDDSLLEVEQFLAEHQYDEEADAGEDEEPYDEAEVAEAFA